MSEYEGCGYRGAWADSEDLKALCEAFKKGDFSDINEKLTNKETSTFIMFAHLIKRIEKLERQLKDKGESDE